MASERIERCVECDEPTGKAGRCEDSLYDDDDIGIGPFCEDCFHKRLAKKTREEQAVSAWEDEIGSKRHWRDEEEYEHAKELVRKGASHDF